MEHFFNILHYPIIGLFETPLYEKKELLYSKTRQSFLRRLVFAFVRVPRGSTASPRRTRVSFGHHQKRAQSTDIAFFFPAVTYITHSRRPTALGYRTDCRI